MEGCQRPRQFQDDAKRLGGSAGQLGAGEREVKSSPHLAEKLGSGVAWSGNASAEVGLVADG